MAKTLLIAEKPSVARDIAAALPQSFSRSSDGTYLEGGDLLISWSVGHLLTLADPKAYNPVWESWRAEDLPIIPERFKIEPIKRRRQKGRPDQLKALLELIRRKDVTALINACDAGREGELIFAYICQRARVRKPVRRLWLSSMTKAAITEAFAALRDGSEMQPLENAARTRAEADWLVGLNATRAATIRLRGGVEGVVSLGRVQTPTLAILARREREIRDFTASDYWTVDADFLCDRSPERRYRGLYRDGHRFSSAAEAEKLAAACRDQAGEITGFEQRAISEPPPLLHDLTALQREASARCGFSAKRTLAAAQGLYEQHKAISYPRTGSRWLTSDQGSGLSAIAACVGRADPVYAPFAERVAALAELPLERVIDDKKVDDHHAIIPTAAEHDRGAMSADERAVYDLVARRFLCVFFDEARIEHTDVTTTVATAHPFTSHGKRLLSPGWRELYGGLRDEHVLPALERGEPVTATQLEVAHKQTKPPRRFTDASLLGAMQGAGRELSEAELRNAIRDIGLGTPATRAQIIERLIDVGYVSRSARKLEVTDKGMTVIELLEKAGSPLVSAELTASWEQRLAAIERGSERRDRLMCEIGEFTAANVTAIGKLTPPPAATGEWGSCPQCGRALQENRKGISCWRPQDSGCGFVIWKRIRGRQLPKGVIRELLARGETSERVSGFKSKGGGSFSARLKLRGKGTEARVCLEEIHSEKPATKRAKRSTGGSSRRTGTKARKRGTSARAPKARRG